MKLCDEKKQRSKRQENGKRYEQKKVAKFMLKEREGSSIDSDALSDSK